MNPKAVSEAAMARDREGGPASWYGSDATLRALLERDLPAGEREVADDWLEGVAAAARDRVAPLSMLADRYPPRLRTHDRLGARIDAIEYDASYLEMQRIAYCELGLVAMKYGPSRRSHTLAFAGAYLFGQAECGLFCPLCMTDGAARVLEKFAAPEVRRSLVPRLSAREPSQLATGAMFLTEKQGGSDVGLSQTRAEKAGERWLLTGDKWFCSNVDAGVILTLARPEGAPPGTRGLGLFVVEPTVAGGERNRMIIHRIKDKLGVRSMPTGEVSFQGAEADLVGELQHGFRYMTEMMNLSRLYNAVGAIGIMRRALGEGRGWAEQRLVFGKRAAEQPLCMETLADLGAETAAATQLVFDGVYHLEALDRGGGDEDRRLVRVLTPLMKYYTAKLAVWAASEGMELVGGNGYIEEFVTARLLRDAQVLPIWEGTSNICVLDALRAMAREGGEAALMDKMSRRLESVRHPRLRGLKETAVRQLGAVQAGIAELAAAGGDRAQHAARRLCDRLVVTYQIAHALSEAERLEALGAGGRDALVAQRLIDRHLAPPFSSPLAARPLDRHLLTILLGDRQAPIAESLG